MTRKQIGIRKKVGHKVGELLLLSKYASDLTKRSGELLKFSRQEQNLVVEMLMPIGLELGIWQVRLENKRYGETIRI